MMDRNFQTKMLLARAYSQTDDYPAAVEGYMKAYELSPHSSSGEKALFQAAFLSYQNRDYDGASRRFEEVARKTRGAVAWDAQWHLAWIRYLKADYDGAEKDFVELAKIKKRRESRGSTKSSTYWRAMAFLETITSTARESFSWTLHRRSVWAITPGPRSRDWHCFQVLQLSRRFRPPIGLP